MPTIRASKIYTALTVCSPKGVRGPQDIPGVQEQTQVEAESPSEAASARFTVMKYK